MERHRFLIMPCLLVGMLLMGACLFIPSDAKADTFYFYQTWAPSADESNSWKLYPRYSTTPTSCYPAQVFNDGHTVNLALSTGSYYFIETGNFTNPDWLGPWSIPIGGFLPYALGQTGDMPGVNATITSVTVLAKFNSQYPATTLYFSTNDKASWTQSSPYSGGGSGGGLPFYAITWNVTALATWNHTVLSSPDLWVKAKFAPVSGVNYYLDYLGFIISWYDLTEGGSEDPLPDPNPEEDEDGIGYDFLYTKGGIIGIMGFIGFIGMVGVPAFAAWTFKNGSETSKIALGVQMLVVWTFCFAMFLVSIG